MHVPEILHELQSLISIFDVHDELLHIEFHL